MERPRHLWEVDAARGLAVVAMVAYHLAWDLRRFAQVPLDLATPGWRAFQITICGAFLLVSGCALAIGRARTAQAPFLPVLRRCARLLAIGLGLGAATALTGIGRIDFGVLHCLAVSLVLAWPLALRPVLAATVGTVVIAAGVVVDATVETHHLVWLGLAPASYRSLDWVPLLPWSGVVLLGCALAHAVFPRGRRRITLPQPPPFVALAGIGRHALAVYLLHQPVLIALVLAAASTAR